MMMIDYESIIREEYMERVREHAKIRNISFEDALEECKKIFPKKFFKSSNVTDLYDDLKDELNRYILDIELYESIQNIKNKYN